MSTLESKTISKQKEQTEQTSVEQKPKVQIKRVVLNKAFMLQCKTY